MKNHCYYVFTLLLCSSLLSSTVYAETPQTFGSMLTKFLGSPSAKYQARVNRSWGTYLAPSQTTRLINAIGLDTIQIQKRYIPTNCKTLSWSSSQSSSTADIKKPQKNDTSENIGVSIIKTTEPKDSSSFNALQLRFCRIRTQDMDSVYVIVNDSNINNVAYFHAREAKAIVRIFTEPMLFSSLGESVNILSKAKPTLSLEVHASNTSPVTLDVSTPQTGQINPALRWLFKAASMHNARVRGQNARCIIDPKATSYTLKIISQDTFARILFDDPKFHIEFCKNPKWLLITDQTSPSNADTHKTLFQIPEHLQLKEPLEVLATKTK